MEIDGSDLADKHFDKILRKYWRIPDPEKRKVIYDYVQASKPCQLEVYSLVDIGSLDGDQAKNFLLQDEGIKRILKADLLWQTDIDGKVLENIIDEDLEKKYFIQH